jgi:hypothetical protein
LLPGAFRGAARGVMLLVLADALDEASGRPGASDVSSGAAAWVESSRCLACSHPVATVGLKASSSALWLRSWRMGDCVLNPLTIR